jgi:hypothetical protein
LFSPQKQFVTLPYVQHVITCPLMMMVLQDAVALALASAMAMAMMSFDMVPPDGL